MNRKEMTISKALANKAKLADNIIIDHSDCEECLEEYLFRFADKKMERYIGLRTILQCFEIARKQDLLPAIPSAWWIEAKTRYD